jgi:hypothetical protein
MTTLATINSTIIAAVLLFLGAIAPASADRVFPPAHLSPEAVFDTGAASEQAVPGAWYHEDESGRRASLRQSETRESSPYPSLYYFVKIRDHANDESARLEAYRSTRRGDETTIADKARVADDQS